MKLLTIIATAMLLASLAQANETYQADGKDITKLQAMQTLLSDPQAMVLRCTPIELTPKATLRNRPKVKSK